ncbi:MAG: hypothetical protein Q4G00_03775 [Clostridia bacterium]|nr:hypothetical protein [Clostridia bacterium]
MVIIEGEPKRPGKIPGRFVFLAGSGFVQRTVNVYQRQRALSEELKILQKRAVSAADKAFWMPALYIQAYSDLKQAAALIGHALYLLDDEADDSRLPIIR